MSVGLEAALPRTMRAAVVYDIDDVRLEERPVPLLNDGDLLVRTAASGICSGDVMPWYIRRKAPVVLGHEPAGTIVATAGSACDDDGATFAPGDRVFVHHHAPCFACIACERGDYVQCAQWRATALEPGGMAEYFRVPAANVRDTLRLPAALDAVAGSLVEPLACVVKSLRRSRVSARDTLYVIGLGVMGLLHVSLARARGITAFASDFVNERRSLAEMLGATAFDAAHDPLAALRAATGGRGADVVICGPGSPAALQHALDAAAPGGTVLMFTPLEPSQRFSFDQSAAYFRDLSLVSSYSCGPDDTREALQALARHDVEPHSIGVREYALDDVAAAYAAIRDGQVVKPVVRFR